MLKRGASACAIAIVMLCAGAAVAAEANAVAEARGVISRTFGEAALAHANLQVMPQGGKWISDAFDYEAHGGELTVRGTSAVALASGYYQYVKRGGLGIDSWTGVRLDLSKGWPDVERTVVSTPYVYRYYFNVVTFGYSTAYWGWERWEREIDWMALHGINMPLSLNATEAIASRVWKSEGLTQGEIDEFYTGPGHLPWQRMGNMANVDGPLSEAWHEGEVRLEHQILDRERALGMRPIAQGFSGFVPRGLKRVRPEVKLAQMDWGGFKKDVEHANILSPDAACFEEIGKKTVQAWEKEFGKGEFFLADSFNEMELPTRAEKNAMLTRYGDVVYRSIAAGDPDATWVMQGWIFINDPKIWTADATEALLRKVPDDKMVILDEALDYNDLRRGGQWNWDKYAGFHNKRWIAGYIPNMGGKTVYTGKIDFYGHAVADALKSPNKGRLSGIGLVPEGIENNERLYELIADTIWTDRAVDVSEWLKGHARARYGKDVAAVSEALELLHRGPYTHLDSQPHYSWQLEPGTGRQTSDNPMLVPAAEKFLSAAGELGENPLYRADLIEMTALAVGGYAERLLNAGLELGVLGDAAGRREVCDRGLGLLTRVDALLSAHPNHRLDRWVGFARARGADDSEADHYEANAKLLVTLWGHDGEIDDYSARVWSGLIGGYYVPRWRMYLDSLEGKKVDIRGFEKKWVATPLPRVPTTRPAFDPVELSRELLAETHKAVPEVKREAVARWGPGDVSEQWKTAEWKVAGEKLAATTLLEFRYERGRHRLEVRSVELLDGETVVAGDEHPGRTGLQNVGNQYSLKMAGAPEAGKTYTLRVSLRTDGGTDSFGAVNVASLPK